MKVFGNEVVRLVTHKDHDILITNDGIWVTGPSVADLPPQFAESVLDARELINFLLEKPKRRSNEV